MDFIGICDAPAATPNRGRFIAFPLAGFASQTAGLGCFNLPVELLEEAADLREQWNKACMFTLFPLCFDQLILR